MYILYLTAGRARRGQLGAGPVELGATWFHGTEGNPVFDCACKLANNSSNAKAGDSCNTIFANDTGDAGQQDRPKDYTANANGSDPR